MSYAIYLRKSRADLDAEKRGEGETLSKHKAALLALAEHKQLEIGRIYQEIVSGDSLSARPEAQQLLDAVTNGEWDGVLVMDIDRLARGDTIDQGLVAQAFRYSNTPIITPIKTYDPSNEMDEEYFEFGLFMARREYKMINRRLQRGRYAAAKNGCYIGGQHPFGYNRYVTPDKQHTLSINEEEAQTVRLIFDLYVNHDYSKCKIANTLNAAGVKSKYGRGWSAETVLGILRNPVYMGKIRWAWREYKKRVENGTVKKSRPVRKSGPLVYVDGLHPPIISEDMFYQAQEILERKKGAPVHTRCALQNPFTGLIKCGICGGTMGRYVRGNGLEILHCRNRGCTNNGIKLADLEQRLLNSLRTWVGNKNIDAPTNTDTEKEAMSLLDILNKEKEKLSEQRNKLHDFLEAGIYTPEVFIERNEVLSKKIEDNAKKIFEIQKNIESQKNLQYTEESLIPQINNLLNVYSSLETAEQKNEMLKCVIKKIELTKNVQYKKGKDFSDFDMVVYPNIKK